MMAGQYDEAIRYSDEAMKVDPAWTWFDALAGQAIDALEDLTRYDASLGAVLEVLQGAQAQLQDAAHSLHAYLGRSEPDPACLAELDARLSSWLSLARPPFAASVSASTRARR